jgi:hypothetical protein
MLCIGYAKSVPDEGSFRAERDPSPVFAEFVIGRRFACNGLNRQEKGRSNLRPFQPYLCGSVAADAHAYSRRAEANAATVVVTATLDIAFTGGVTV